MKVLIIGNCQIESIQACLRFLLPQATVTLEHSWNLSSKFGNTQNIKRELENFDLVLAHRFYNVPGLDFDELLSTPAFIEFPALNFLSFHPDCIYLVDADSKKIVRSVLGDYNSAIAAYCYSNAVSIERCLHAFRAEVYDKVGYFNNWNDSVSALEAEFQRCGLSANIFLPKWVSRKPFAHSINHPRLFAVHDVLVAVLTKAGIDYRYTADIEDFVADPLLSYAGWPVYEEIAQHHGFKGNYYFRGNVEHNAQYIFSLSEFIEKTYSAYEQAGVKRFVSDIFSAWDKIQLAKLI